MGQQHAADALDALLDELPSSHVLARCGEVRLAVGRPGAFVLVRAAREVAVRAEVARRHADQLRDQLADHLAWVPWVDALVVTSRADRDLRRCVTTVVPLDLVPSLLRDGPPVVDPATVRGVRDLLRARRLPGWIPGLATADARIDLCEPAAPTTQPL